METTILDFTAQVWFCVLNKLNGVKMLETQRNHTSMKTRTRSLTLQKDLLLFQTMIAVLRAEPLFWNVRTRRPAAGKLYEVRGAGPEAADPELWQDLTPGHGSKKNKSERKSRALKVSGTDRGGSGSSAARANWTGFQFPPVQYDGLRLRSINFCEVKKKKPDWGPSHGFLRAQMFEMTEQFLRKLMENRSEVLQNRMISAINHTVN